MLFEEKVLFEAEMLEIYMPSELLPEVTILFDVILLRLLDVVSSMPSDVVPVVVMLFDNI